jgi:hypothetical protein
MDCEALEQLRDRVIDDPQLRAVLLRSSDRDAFVERILATAADLGIGLTRAEILAGLREARAARDAQWV